MDLFKYQLELARINSTKYVKGLHELVYHYYNAISGYHNRHGHHYNRRHRNGHQRRNNERSPHHDNHGNSHSSRHSFNIRHRTTE